MKIVTSFKSKLPGLKSSLLAILSAILLILAFPDFEIWFLAWVALVPFFYAVDREKDSVVKGFALGWLFGTVFFFGSCWWLSFPMTHYAGFPWPIAYALVLLASLTVGLLPAIFAALLSVLLKRFGTVAILSAPFLWTLSEFLRFYVTGNNWNAIAYSQAFHPFITKYASLGGIYLVSFGIVYFNTIISFFFLTGWWKLKDRSRSLDENELYKAAMPKQQLLIGFFSILLIAIFVVVSSIVENQQQSKSFAPDKISAFIIAIQPNVPMSGLKIEDWQRLRDRHIELSEKAVSEIISRRLETVKIPDGGIIPENIKNQLIKETEAIPKIIIFPESPMNFEYTRDHEFQEFLKNFTAKNKVSVLFNAGEPSANQGIYNSAVLVNARGERIGQYDKIHLLPFGEFIPLPAPIADFIPPVVGNFEFGKSYDLLPFGDAQVGTMICFESHFPTLSRQYALEGADALVEMTNDGYLGNTAVLRQHLASAVFRAVETNRPVLRVTNVGITAFIDERGEFTDATKPYVEDTRIWTLSKSDGSQTFYVKYGDWMGWLCSIVSLVLLGMGFKKWNVQRKF